MYFLISLLILFIFVIIVLLIQLSTGTKLGQGLGNIRLPFSLIYQLILVY